jgi:hypothetical protein
MNSRDMMLMAAVIWLAPHASKGLAAVWAGLLLFFWLATSDVVINAVSRIADHLRRK